jgi:hypothetical protein
MRFLPKFKPRSAPLVYASKEYVEHLRTVHFALLAVSAGLLLLVLSAKPYDSRKAILQMGQILKLKSQWSPNWILEHQTRRSRGYHATGGLHGDKRDIISIEPTAAREGSQTIVVKLTPELTYVKSLDPRKPMISTKPFMNTKPLFLRFTPPSNETFFWVNEPDIHEHDLDTVPDRLDFFAVWWEELGRASHKFIHVASIVNKCTVDNPITVLRGCHLYTEPRKTKNTLKWERVFAEYGAGPFPKSIHLVGSDPVIGSLQFVVASYSEFSVSQTDVLDLFPGSPPGAFSTSFQDLYRATAGIQSSDLDNISRYLQANSSASEVFEAFGLKIPSEQVTTWGTIVILCIQSYLFLYLRGFKKPLESADKAWDVGWFAVSSGVLPRSMLFVTVFVLPATAVITMLSQQALRMRGQLSYITAFVVLSLFITACLASLTLGYLCWRNRPSVKPEAATSRSPLFE